MNQRQIDILGLILKEYINSGVPVASEMLVDKYNLDFSSATIRNEMMELEKQGFLYQPHTSAGRVPSDKGYRFYVDYLMKLRELSKNEEEKLKRLFGVSVRREGGLKKQVLESQENRERLIHNLAKVIAELSNALVITGIPDDDFYEQAGMRNFLDQYGFENTDEMQQVLFDLEYLDKNTEELAGLLNGNVKIYIGAENPLRHIQRYSTIISSYELPGQEQGFLALVGPKRMDYEKNISLIDYIINNL